MEDMQGTPDPFAELANLTIDIAREIRLRGHATLTPSESMAAHDRCSLASVCSASGVAESLVERASPGSGLLATKPSFFSFASAGLTFVRSRPVPAAISDGVHSGWWCR